MKKKNIFGDRSNLYRSFDADDVFIMMSDMGSNYHYFAYEPALKYSFDINFLDEMKSCGDIVRYEYCDRKKKQILHEALPNGHPSKYSAHPGF